MCIILPKLLGNHLKNTFFDQNRTSINDFNNIDQLFTEPDWHNDLYQVPYSLLLIKAKAVPVLLLVAPIMVLMGLN
ncbi:MAG: hypothetical protein JWQ54_38 [Mucilaginibacter sp.]|nr:hypothetical protein [Mucilaginibacter sp.]